MGHLIHINSYIHASNSAQSSLSPDLPIPISIGGEGPALVVRSTILQSWCWLIRKDVVTLNVRLRNTAPIQTLCVNRGKTMVLSLVCVALLLEVVLHIRRKSALSALTQELYEYVVDNLGSSISF